MLLWMATAWENTLLALTLQSSLTRKSTQFVMGTAASTVSFGKPLKKKWRKLKMSEDKNKWKEEIRAILKEELKAIQTPPSSEFGKASLALPEHVAMPRADKGHETVDEVADCPNCKPKLMAKFKPEILKEQREKIKSMTTPHRCDDCGDVYDRENEEDCPTCHGHKAH